MAKILKPKIKASGLMDAFEMGVFKTVSERTAAPMIGNGTITSGTVKLIGAGVLSSLSRNRHVGLLSSAVIIDGVEDVVNSLLGNIGGDIIPGAASGGDW
jgi:hypothetical protein